MKRYDEITIKQNVSAVEIVSLFLPLKKKGVNYVTRCPFHNEKTGSFTVSPQKNIYTCFGCGKTGDAIQFLIDYKKQSYGEALEFIAQRLNIEPLQMEKPKVYKKPVVKENKTQLSENLVAWFNKRGISQQTLIELKISEGPEFIPQVGKVRNTVQFNYFKKGEVVNIKYRDGEKNFKLVSGAELIFYNLDAIQGAEEIIIVEGEIDALTVHQVGYKNVISVPNGAARNGNSNLQYLDNSIEYLPETAKYLLALDNDGPGNNLTEEIARRLGVENCYRVIFDDCKDANESLVKNGPQAVINAIKNKKEFPIIGVYKASDIEAQIDDYYNNGLPKGCNINEVEFDDFLKFHLGYLTTLTGIPGDGKSEFLDFLSVKLNILHNWKFALYSPENFPMQLHFSKFAEKLIGKPWEGFGRINALELKQAKRYFEENYFFINPEEDFSLDSILSTVRQLIRKKGINAFVIDAWNKLEHKYKGDETKYISEELDKIVMFCQRNNVHCFLVAHPTKTGKNADGTFVVPNLYSISGSANFFNKTANGICVYRDRLNPFTTQIHIQKVKFKHWGKPGMVVFAWDSKTGRYYKGGPDWENWINKKEVQLTTEFKAAAPLPANDTFLSVVKNEPENPGIITNENLDLPF